jgi:thiamine pyrophosphate-dependent acetolactate synthase large subunit-like protein
MNKIQKGERVNGIEKDPLESQETDIVIDYANVPGFLRKETSTQGDDKLRIAAHEGGVDTVKNVLDRFRQKKEEIQKRKQQQSEAKKKEEEIKEEEEEEHHNNEEPVEEAVHVIEEVKQQVTTIESVVFHEVIESTVVEQEEQV